MSLTLSSPISTATTILNDPGEVRYTAAEKLQYANDALDQLVTLLPHLFHAEGEVACVSGLTLQSVSYDDARALVAVRRVKDGPALTRADPDMLDAFTPDWHLATPAQAKHWLAVEGDPIRFLVYPPAPANQVLDVLYVRIPPEYAATDATGIPATYGDAIADYIVHRCEARDDDHINSNRAAQFLASFVEKVKA